MDLSDVLLGVGFALVVFGVWQFSPPAAYILAGVFLAATGYLLGGR